ncbi:hypothetical protein QCN17_23095 [Enterobacter asburiae]|uniref:hypothetical protein n=1 Tax=Enterobacter asburiae TaxID=61645 RepID=UPI002FD7F9FE
MINERLTIERLSEVLKNMQGYAARDRQLSMFVDGCAVFERVDPTFIDCVTALTELLECRSANPVLMPGDSVLIPVQSQAWRDVTAERQRQITVEGWTPEHDDEYEHGELADAAGCYALHSEIFDCAGEPPRPWPWPDEWWKPTNRRRDLVKAGALILAEIERIDRQGQTKNDQ